MYDQLPSWMTNLQSARASEYSPAELVEMVIRSIAPTT